MPKIQKIKAASIITKSKLPGADYVINPYIGCSHSCIYCYARFMKRFTNHDEPWGKFIDVKINAAELIPKSLKKYKGKQIFLSSVTDPCLPLEKKYQLTRKILKKLLPAQPALGIQTKSSLITRDIDLLRKFKNCEVGLTITTLKDEIRKEIEPGASPIKERIKALEKLNQAGIKTYVFIGPIIPYVTNWQEIVLKTKDFVDSYMFENLNVSGSIWDSVEKWLASKPVYYSKGFKKIYFSQPNNFWDKVENQIKTFCHRHKIEYKIYFHHGKRNF